MGILGWAIGIGVAGKVIDIIRKDLKESEAAAAEEARRRSTPCYFQDGISKTDFERLAKNVGKSIKRISSLSVDGPIVFGVVKSQSGISEWSFTIDYNDYGHITGKYWLSSENSDSNIPKRVADMISTTIQNYSPDSFKDNGPSESFIEKRFCPYCGKLQFSNSAAFCVYCGKRLY